MKIVFDEIEWITKDNKKMIKKLGLNTKKNFPNGFYIYNSSNNNKTYKISKNTIFKYIDENNNFAIKNVTFDEFILYYYEYIKKFIKPYLDNNKTDFTSNLMPCWIEIKDNIVIRIEQQYVP